MQPILCLSGTWPWLRRRGWMRDAVARQPSVVALFRNSLDHPLVRRAWPPEDAEALLHRWAERERRLDALDRSPQTPSHFDTFRRNLFARCTPGDLDQTVAIDWAFSGIGAVGEEIVPLIAASLLFFAVEIERARELDATVFDAYLQGLSEAGHRAHRPKLVRLVIRFPTTDQPYRPRRRLSLH